MLAADKLQLQSALKQQAVALKEKEFNLHHSNLMTVGTQAAVLAGLDITMFIEFQPPPTEAWDGHAASVARCLKFAYFVMIVTAFCCNMMVVAHTTTLSVIGAGLALRGPDGSMMTATDGLYEERRSVFSVFAAGLACTVGSVVLCVWLILHWEAALVCMVVTLYTCCKMHGNYRRVMKRFDFDESETVDFQDIFNGPASIRVMPKKRASQGRGGGGWLSSSSKKSSNVGSPSSSPPSSKQLKQKEDEMLLPHHSHGGDNGVDDPWKSANGDATTVPSHNKKSSSPILRRQNSQAMMQLQQQFGQSSIQTV